MGQMKRYMEDVEAVRDEAAQIAIRAGWMTRCEYHGVLMIDDEGEKGHAYALANSRVTKRKTDTSREALKEALDFLNNDTVNDCALCVDHHAE